MTRVLVTHADEPIGRRVVKCLYHDPHVETVLAVGAGATPRAFDRFLAGETPRVGYLRVDLAKHRPMAELFRSARFREAAIDTIVHVPRHGAAEARERPLVSGVAERTAEARLVLQHSLETPSVKSLVALGSAFVYRLQPGNANRLTEASELDLDPDIAPEIRSWIDADMILHGEIHNERLRVVLLRAPTVVASGGYVYMNPALPPRSRPRWRTLGFDPLCALVSDKDTARAIQAAVHAKRSGVYNIAGRECVPLSTLARWTGRSVWPLPSPLLAWAAAGSRLLRAETPFDGPPLRFGFTLDTRRAEAELGFRPSDRIGLARAGDGRVSLETPST